MKLDFRDELGKMTPKIADGAKVYIFGCGANWEKICKQYKQLADIDLDDCVDGFVDNNPNKQGTVFHGKSVLKPDEITPERDVVLISTVTADGKLAIGEQLVDYGMYIRHSFFMEDVFTKLLMRWEYTRLLQFKDKHKNERCFIIGNGPSLLPSDLDTIKGEYSFAANRIYLMFDKTSWRPSYYVAEDPIMIKESHRDIKEQIMCDVFYSINSVSQNWEYSVRNNSRNDYFYSIDYNDLIYKPPAYAQATFSEDAHILCWGATVTYSCLQLAAYMGFSEIILIGHDHSFPLTVDDYGQLVYEDVDSHFIKTYGKNLYLVNLDQCTTAYISARKYAEQHNIKILNATRGGKLEVFERVDFASLFM